MTRALTAFLVLFFTAAAPTAGAASAADKQQDTTAPLDPIALLGRAADAVRDVTYRGTIVYLRSSDVDTLQVIHRLHDGLEQERLISQSGAPREVIRKGDEVTSILPEHRVVLVSEHPPKSLLGSVKHFSPDRLRQYYSVSSDGTVRFAGRTCRVIKIQPSDRFRYGYRMYIDQKTDLPLKLALRYQGNRLEQLMFTDVSFPASIPDDDFLPSYDFRGYKIIRHRSVQMDDKHAESAPEPWHVEDLPPGFRLAEDGVRQVTADASVRQMLFTDGVATVSAFIAPAGLRAPLKGATRMGAVNAFGSIVGNSQITVVGEVPAVTAERIAHNLSRIEKTRAANSAGATANH